MAQHARASGGFMGAGIRRVVAAVAAGLLLGGCAGALDPAGPVADRQRWLFLVALVIAGVITVGVVGATLRALRSRDGLRDGNRFVVLGGLVMPTVVLMGVMGLTFVVLADELPADDELVVEVEGNQYWWEVRYPDAGVVTANEIHVPVDRPVRFVVTTDDVLHSVWVPELGGKIDMVPGRTNEVVLQADEAGLYEGACAEFCGLQHAKMRFHVVAEPADEFAAWLDEQAEPAEVGRAAMQALTENSCAACHTIRGTSATGQLGPDLTHFGSRLFLGAGILVNNRENLQEWVPATQSLKHGALMPDLPQAEDDLDVLVDTLMGLQ